MRELGELQISIAVPHAFAFFPTEAQPEGEVLASDAQIDAGNGKADRPRPGLAIDGIGADDHRLRRALSLENPLHGPELELPVQVSR